MKKFAAALIALIAFAALPASAALKYKLAGQLAGGGNNSSNDLAFSRWTPSTARSFGTNDSVFGLMGDTSKSLKFNTSSFQSARAPLNGVNPSQPSYPVAVNPDSVVCRALIKHVDSDVSNYSFGIFDSLSGSVGWNAYGATATADTLAAATTGWQAIRTTIPWVSSTIYKPYLTVTSATDTLTVGYMDCKIINRN